MKESEAIKEIETLRRLDVQIKVFKVIFMILLGILSVLVGYGIHDYIHMSQPVKMEKKVQPIPQVSLGNEVAPTLNDPGANAASV